MRGNLAIKTYRDLKVYRQANDAALDISRLTKKFPLLEQVELARQLRRAARSVPATIVEGWAKRSSTPEFKRYLQIAAGSCMETRMWLEMSKDERYITEPEYEQRNLTYEAISAMLAGLWKEWRTFRK